MEAMTSSSEKLSAA